MVSAAGRRQPGVRLPAWAVTEGPLGVRLFDAGVVVLVIAAIELDVKLGGGAGAVPLSFTAYLFGALLAVPVLFRHRWPFRVLIASALVMFFYYIFERRNISPAPVFFVPLYDAAVEGYLALVIAIPAFFMIVGAFVVEASTREGLASLAQEFLSQSAILALGVTLGEVVRSRQSLTAETARRLRLADFERAAEAGRVVAEERLRIARELHDTVAHSMATITVQAGSALHLLGEGIIQNDPASSSQAAFSGPGADADTLRAALTAIRGTGKEALNEMRSVLGQLRRSDHDAAVDGGKGLSGLAALREAVVAAGASVTVAVEGDPWPLSADTDHSAYRILQESLTNVLRHAGPGAAARVCLRYRPEVLVITVADDGGGGLAGDAADAADAGVTAGGDGEGGGGRGHGISGMRERATLVGGELTAEALVGGGFQVRAILPIAGRPAASAASDVTAASAASAQVLAGREEAL